ncbi:MAG: RsmB/NOP family class I SAM-dependent RNA methyltransferase [Treponema sp.]|nr:RsmB/NOP family class I SAM-dependent RNA methyltransferase [Treponema sp.]
MKQKENTKKKLQGASGFDEYYSSIYGERWNSLKESFLKESQSVEWKVPGSQKSYFLDSASVLAAVSLPLENSKNILDLCAAPGGKTVVIASRMPSDAVLSSNERSPDRKHRLSVVVQTCLPPEINKNVKVSCSDGSTWCTRQTECFDTILLDAPCSSERHVYNDSKYLNQWSLSRIKTVTTEQWALLSCAFRLLAPGGTLLYSTCALCPQENDEMIRRLIKKFNKEKETFTFLEPNLRNIDLSTFSDVKLPEFERTEFGYQILPDKSNGAGPIYFCLIKKQILS